MICQTLFSVKSKKNICMLSADLPIKIKINPYPAVCDIAYFCKQCRSDQMASEAI